MTIPTIGTFKDVPVVQLTDSRIRQEERKEGLYYYNFRDSDNGSSIASLEKHVLVNHFGTLVTTQPIEYLEVDNDDNGKWLPISSEEERLICEIMY